MKLTVDHLRACYGMLSDLPPFCRWNLPDKHDIHFAVLKTKRWHADHWRDKGQHIRISAGRCEHLYTLTVAMAHEMVHTHLNHNKIHERHDHGIAFKTAAKEVCTELGFDPAEF